MGETEEPGGDGREQWQAPMNGETETSRDLSVKEQQLQDQLEALNGFSPSGSFRADVERFFASTRFARKIPELRAGTLDAVQYLKSIKHVNGEHSTYPLRGSDQYDSPEGQRLYVALLTRENEIVDQLLSSAEKQPAQTRQTAAYRSPETEEDASGDEDLRKIREARQAVAVQIAEVEKQLAERPDDPDLQQRLRMLRLIGG